MALRFDALTTRYSVPIDDVDRFQALLDSESYVTGGAAFKNGNAPLSECLNKETMASRTDYNGHFGPHIVFDLDVEDDTPEQKALILEIIEEHLDWCMTLPVREDVKEQRKSNGC